MRSGYSLQQESPDRYNIQTFAKRFQRLQNKNAVLLQQYNQEAGIYRVPAEIC